MESQDGLSCDARAAPPKSLRRRFQSGMNRLNETASLDVANRQSAGCNTNDAYRMFVVPEDVTSDYIVDGSSPTKEPHRRESQVNDGRAGFFRRIACAPRRPDGDPSGSRTRVPDVRGRCP